MNITPSKSSSTANNVPSDPITLNNVEPDPSTVNGASGVFVPNPKLPLALQYELLLGPTKNLKLGTVKFSLYHSKALLVL